MAKQDDYVRYTIRVPKELYALIEKAAAKANRSVNAEIVENLTFAQLDDIGDRAELLLRMHQMRETHDDAAKKAIEKDVYWSNITLALNNLLRANVAQFRATILTILSYGDQLPQPVKELCETMLLVYQEMKKEFKDSAETMRFLKRQSEEAEKFVYAEADASKDQDPLLFPPIG